jgi:arginine transport system permease protein
MEVMGHGQLLYGRTYDVMVFAAGVVYLVVNGLLTLMMRLIERKALAFERRN